MADKMSKLVLPVKTGNTITNKEFDVGGGNTNTFVGTTAEWEALTSEQQNAYDCRVLTDDDLDTKNVIDNLTSDSATDALSAKQGKVLKGLVDTAQAQVSNSDDVYSPTRPYKVDDLCIHNNVLYRCTTACSAGSWATNQSCFEPDTLANAVNGLNRNLTNSAFAVEVVIANTDNPTTAVYTFGYDGYLTAKSAYGSGNYLYAVLYGASSVARLIEIDCTGNVNGNSTNVVFVKKGMKCAYVSSQGSFSLKFTAII